MTDTAATPAVTNAPSTPVALSVDILETLTHQAYNCLYADYNKEATQLEVEKAEKAAGRQLSSYERQNCNRYKLRSSEMKAVQTVLASIAPQNIIEGMFAVQIAALHFAAMEYYSDASKPELGFASRNEYLKNASKLSRTFSDLQEALDHHRGKGNSQQTINVIYQHVHVTDGGQAVVGGNVTPAAREGGAKKMKNNPKKSLNYAPEITVPSPDTQRPMSVGTNG